MIYKVNRSSLKTRASNAKSATSPTLHKRSAQKGRVRRTEGVKGNEHSIRGHRLAGSANVNINLQPRGGGEQ